MCVGRVEWGDGAMGGNLAYPLHEGHLGILSFENFGTALNG